MINFLSFDMFFWGQVVGFIALLICVGKYQFKNTKTVMWINAVACGFWIFHNLLLGGLTGALMNSVAFFRNIICLKVKAHVRKSVFLVSLGVAGFLVLQHSSSLIDLLPFFGFFCFGLANVVYDRPLAMRLVCIAGDIFWLIYALSLFAIPLIITCFLGIISSVIGILRYERDAVYNFLKIISLRTYP
ncbi:MAG: YgjV family protein [Pseudomonadota bacterium]